MAQMIDKAGSPEAGAAAAEASDGTRERQERAETNEAALEALTPTTIRSPAILILATLAIIYTLYFGREVLLPVTIALILNLLLQPAMRFMTRTLRLPELVAALLLIMAVFGVLMVVAASISVPASGWLQKAPQSLPLLEEKLSFLKQPIEFFQRGLRELATHLGGGAVAGKAPGEPAISPALGVAAGSVAWGAANTLSRLFTVLVVLFFLLASGERLLRGLVEVLPRFKQKRQAVAIVDEIEDSIVKYLVTITAMNALVGIGAGLTMHLTGIGDPLLWGTVAFLLNYIPILGPLAGVVLFLAVGLVTFESAWFALVPAGIYLAIHVAEGETITPMLLAKRFTLNPALVILSLFFWDAVWGVPGAFLAVPLLAIFKILCDQIEPLHPIGHVIGS